MHNILKELSLFLQIPEQDIRPAVSFPGYFITAYGDIVSCLGRAPRCLKHLNVNQVDKAVLLRRNGRSGCVLVHNLILESYVGPKPTGHRAYFKDGNRDNLTVENLEWRPRTAEAWAKAYECPSEVRLDGGIELGTR